MLTPYDEFPVHQAPYPFSHIPATDTGWDDGYWFGAFSPDDDVFLFTGMRVSPNTDMIGGYAGISHAGRQYTARFSRVWRDDFSTRIGPFGYEVIEPYRDIRVTLDPWDDVDLRFDFHWLGLAPPFEEDHHVATTRGRRTTDQTRYSQAGTASGWFEFEGQRREIAPSSWYASRDHSWGLYAQRAPIAPDPALLPPRPTPAVRRAFRFWSTFVTGDYSGFFHLHEAEDGSRATMNDTFGTPFEGQVHRGWDAAFPLVDAEHDLTFRGKTRVMEHGTLTMTDLDGGTWIQRFETVGQPWSPFPVGYNVGTWRDGGTLHTYHGTDGPFVETDDFNISVQPFKRQLYNGLKLTVWGCEYLARVELTDPKGRTSHGAAQVEIFLDGRYDPYGFVAEGRGAPSYWGGYAIVDDDD